MKHTHKKRAYHASCTQYDGWNNDEVLDILNDGSTYAVPYGGDSIMVRFANPTGGQKAIDTVNVGDWIVVGENGMKKCYTDEQFKIKYEELK